MKYLRITVIHLTEYEDNFHSNIYHTKSIKYNIFPCNVERRQKLLFICIRNLLQQYLPLNTISIYRIKVHLYSFCIAYCISLKTIFILGIQKVSFHLK